MGVFKPARQSLAFINSESREEFIELAEKNPVFEKAVNVLSMVSADKSNRMLYETRLKEWRDNKSRIDGVKAEGIGIVFSLLEQGLSLAEAKKKLGCKP
jgi:hypothetical protein